MKTIFLAGLLLAAAPAAADDLELMDTSQVDPALVKDFYGAWQISDESGKKHCRVELKSGATIGGQEIDVDPACARAFPIMDEITAWRLMQGWAIDLVDATRKMRVRFFTPDAGYIAEPTADGIFTIDQLPK